jgi:hypothetical protein
MIVSKTALITGVTGQDGAIRIASACGSVPVYFIPPHALRLHFAISCACCSTYILAEG